MLESNIHLVGRSFESSLEIKESGGFFYLCLRFETGKGEKIIRSKCYEISEQFILRTFTFIEEGLKKDVLTFLIDLLSKLWVNYDKFLFLFFSFFFFKAIPVEYGGS